MQDYLKSLTATAPKYKSLGGLKAPALSSLTSLFSFGSSNAPKSTPVQASTPSATPSAPSPTPTAPVKPPVASTSTSSPAKTQYVNSLVSTPATPPVASTPSTPATPSKPPAGSVADTSYLDAYRDYLSQYASSLKPSDELVAANKSLADISSKIDERNLKSRREYEAKLDESGLLKGGAEASARLTDRRNASELADLAVVQSGAARQVEALGGTAKANSEALKTMADLYKPLQIGDTYIDPKTGKIVYSKPSSVTDQYGSGIIGEYNFAKANGYTGSFEQYQNEDANRKRTANSITTTGTGVPGQLSALAQAVQNGTIAIDKLPAAQRAAVAAELATSGIPTNRQTTLSSNLQVVNDLLSNSAIGAISGVPALTAFLPGTNAQMAKNLYNQLKGILSLENREKLKGSGAISDFEFKVLSEAATALGRNLSDKDFKKQLEKVRDVFEGKYALTNAGSTTGAPLPDTGGGDAEYQAYLRSINAQ